MTHMYRTSVCERFLHLCRFLSVFLLLPVAAAIPSFGQQFASLTLNINDPRGAAIAQADVSIRNVDTGVARTAASDKLGVAAIPGLSAGSYQLTINANGFNAYDTPLTL